MGKDYLLDESDDYIVKDGDFFYGDSEEQEVYQIMRINPGEIREKPILGFGFAKRTKTIGNDEDIKKDLDTQLRLDGFKNILISVKIGLIKILKATR